MYYMCKKNPYIWEGLEVKSIDSEIAKQRLNGSGELRLNL